MSGLHLQFCISLASLDALAFLTRVYHICTLCRIGVLDSCTSYTELEGIGREDLFSIHVVHTNQYLPAIYHILYTRRVFVYCHQA
jgi:hypothetical protein